MKTQKGLGILLIAAAAAVPARATAQIDPTDVTPAAADADTGDLPDPVLVRRWAQLFSYVLGEFRRDGRDPTGIVQGDFSSGELRLLTHTTQEGKARGVSARVGEQQLRAEDLRAVAAKLYQAWKADGDR